jgi:hypothetical protein
MSHTQIILISMAIYTMFVFGFDNFGMSENANYGLVFWPLAFAGAIFQIYAFRTLPGRLKLVPLIPLILFSLGVVGIFVYFMLILP